MCEIITIGGRLAHASSLTYRFWGDASREESLFWGDASREESLFGVTPRARRHPKKKIPRARRHPNACEESPRKWTYGP